MKEDVIATWQTANRTLEDFNTSIRAALGEYADEYDIDAIEDEYRDAINAALPEQVTFSGGQFFGPYYEDDRQWDEDLNNEDGNLDIKEIIDSIGFWEIVDRNVIITIIGNKE